MRKGIFAILLLCGFAATDFKKADATPGDVVKIKRCILRVDRKTYISGVCEYRYSRDRLEFGQKRPRNYYSYFGFIEYRNSSATMGEGTWNGPDIHSMHGDNLLGILRRHGACWSNERASLCTLPTASTHSPR